MTIAQRTQLAALRALRNHPELGKTHEERRLPTALGTLSEARDNRPEAAPAPREAATETAPNGRKSCPMALKLLLED